MTSYPVMLHVAGRRCLVVGGGRVALRKVEGLACAGADVTVIAPEIDPRIEALGVVAERRPYRSGDAAGFRLIITATDDPAVNAQVFDDAEAAGVWVNSADDIDHCSFTLPAIHRDGAVTVAVSTDGQSPAFAGWLRDRVRETLPLGLADVAAQIANERRAVHDRGESTEDVDWRSRIDELVADRAELPAGTVHLVGAGPGDPELLTLRAARLLASADVVVHDALAGTEALALVPAHVERIDVGKRPGRPVPQELINDLLVHLAQRHRCVVRLKGGDPFLFGRGGEEALSLQAAGVPFEVVPGVTSAFAAPAAAGVPVTQRGMSASVTVVTGHRRYGDEDETDWEALARVGGTIVVLMGVAERAVIARRLLAGGLSADTPVTAVRYGTRPEQEVARTTLAELGETPIEAPAAIVIGAVAGLDLSSDAIARATMTGWPPPRANASQAT